MKRERTYWLRLCKNPSPTNHICSFSRISTPRTKYSAEPIHTVPLYGLELMKKVIGGLFPELADIGFTDSRVGSIFIAPECIADMGIEALLVH